MLIHVLTNTKIPLVQVHQKDIIFPALAVHCAFKSAHYELCSKVFG